MGEVGTEKPLFKNHNPALGEDVDEARHHPRRRLPGQYTICHKEHRKHGAPPQVGCWTAFLVMTGICRAVLDLALYAVPGSTIKAGGGLGTPDFTE